MLTALSIRDVVLIERLELCFGPGLTVLTGETGAGKSILLDSLGLALGGRAEAGLVRAGAEQASVAACFAPPAQHPATALLAEQGIAGEDEIVLRRVVGRDGRSRGFVNDQPVSVALLRRAGALLVEVQGQHEQMGLADPASHAGLLDAFGVPAPLRQAVGAAWRDWREAQSALTAARQAIATAQRDEDWLRHAVDELAKLAPAEGEEDRLAAERQRLQQGERRAEAIAAALSELTPRDRRSSGPGAALRAASRALQRLIPAGPAGRSHRCGTRPGRAGTRRGSAGRSGNPADPIGRRGRRRSPPAGTSRGAAVRPARRRPQAPGRGGRTARPAGSAQHAAGGLADRGRGTGRAGAGGRGGPASLRRCRRGPVGGSSHCGRPAGSRGGQGIATAAVGEGALPGRGDRR